MRIRDRSLASTLLAASLLFAFAGCGEVAKCERGAPGCLAGPPPKGADCSFGLVLINGACAEPGSEPPALSCQCENGQACTLDEYVCVDYCAPLEVEIGSEPAPPPLSCSPDDGFDVLCAHRCELRCRQWQDYCPDSAGCNPEACRSDAERAACRAECGNDGDATRCMAQHCTDTLAAGCRAVACPQDKPPACEGVQCRNSCPRFNFDGVCDDGDLLSASSGVCAFGTDCGDCGPRRGAAPKPSAQGSACAFHSNCAGSNPESLAEAASWCITIEEGISRCAPDCSDEGEICPEGSACFELAGADQDGDGEPDPVVAGERRASACFPVACQ
jgi:hypothetical protein